jgi:hypothetical protein
MSGYRVKFFKNLVNCYGRPFKVLQRTIVVGRSNSPTEAVEAAQRRFERFEKVPDWKLHADCIEWESAGNDRHLPV